MERTAVRNLQWRLADAGLYSGKVDGDAGPRTAEAVAAALQARAAKLPDGWQAWPDRRKAIACLQLLAHEAGLDAGRIDGQWGPQTEFASDNLTAMRKTGAPEPNWRDSEVRPRPNPNRWPKESQSVLDEFFGPHGLPDGRSPAIQPVECPWTLKIAWDRRQTTRKIGANVAVADSLARVLHKVRSIYSDEDLRELGLDVYGGCYNARRKRGGTSLSTHSWAIAIDWDPDRNQLKWGRDKARLAGPDYEDWWNAWEEEGWLSLGRERNFDWMHVQATA